MRLPGRRLSVATKVLAVNLVTTVILTGSITAAMVAALRSESYRQAAEGLASR